MGDRFQVGVHCSRGVGPTHGGREQNEDNYLIARQGRARFLDENGDREGKVPGHAGIMLAVADGMGGHSFGALASATAIQAMLRLYNRGRPRAPGSTLFQFVQKAHVRLRERANAKGAADMGTTLTAIWVIENQAWWVHVGDSRLYHLRDGSLSQLTRDHTRAEFARRDGRPLPRQPNALCQSFIYGSRGLGSDQKIRLDRGVDTGHIELARHDRLLLCSDGISGALAHHEMAARLDRTSDNTAAQAADGLAEAAMQAGSTDNVTAVVLDVEQLLPVDDTTQWNLFETTSDQSED